MAAPRAASTPCWPSTCWSAGAEVVARIGGDAAPVKSRNTPPVMADSALPFPVSPVAGAELFA